MFSSRKPMHAALLAAGTLLTAFGLAGCGNSDSQTPPTAVVTPPSTTVVTPPPAVVSTTTPPGATVTTPPGPNTKINVNAGPGTSVGTDQATADAVNKAIVTNKQMTGSRVEAVVTDGVATLTGSTQNAQQKGLAEKAARDTPGVSSVKNKIQINPTGGAKSASKPPVTKVIVVHKTVTVPGPATSNSAATPPADGTGTGDGASPAPSAPSNTDGGAGTAPAAGGTPAPPASGGGQ